MVNNVAVYYEPGSPYRFYFFQGDKWARIELKPGSLDDSINLGPLNMHPPIGRRIGWGSLKQAGFYTVDAVLPVPGSVGDAYFFSGSKCALIQVASISPHNDTLIRGPFDISDFKSVKAADFTSIDAAILVPGTKWVNQAYLFSGEKYIRIDVIRDRLLSGPSPITDKWTSLRDLGFTTVDTAFPVPGNPHDTFFFNGSKYAQVHLHVDNLHDSVVVDAKYIDRNWPSLRTARFY